MRHKNKYPIKSKLCTMYGPTICLNVLYYLVCVGHKYYNIISLYIILQSYMEELMYDSQPRQPIIDASVDDNIPIKDWVRMSHMSYFILLAITTVMICAVNYAFYQYIRLPDRFYIISILCTLVAPIVLNLYSLSYNMYNIDNSSEQKLLKELDKEMELEVSSKLPFILFGLGLFIDKMEKKHISLIFQYLIVSLIFGTIIAEMLPYVIFDHNNVIRLTIVGELEYLSKMISYGFLAMGMYLILYFL